MADTQRALPDFDNPPVVETVLGIEFAPLKGWGIPHFGLFWQETREEYPRFDVQAPLVSQIEKFDKEPMSGASVRLQMLTDPPVRCWFYDRSETRLLQVQNDRFIHNWRKTREADAYPRYESIRAIFQREWTRFCDFLRSQNLGKPDVRQCEVTYVNHLEGGEGWETAADLPGVIAGWSGNTSDRFLPSPEALGLNVNYRMPNEQGRLRVELQSAVRHADVKNILRLTLTARGRPSSSETRDVLSWMDFGREWVVRGFADFTHTRMHEMWKRKDKA